MPLDRRATVRGLATIAATLTSLGTLPASVALADDALLAEEVAEGTATGAEAAPAAIQEEAPPEISPPEISPLELVTLALVNGARASRGLEPLQWDSTMADVARAHARDMMERGTVSHYGSDGSSPRERLRRAGVEFRFGSENIWTYWGQAPDDGPRTMHAAMMAEPHVPGLWNHIANILHDGYRRIGIGIVTAPSGVQYLSETFAD
ncbi:MAG: CAP domain-containing protein [Chloroflexota bacterium]